jgi:GNAT superfamily N-acetyltransferase
MDMVRAAAPRDVREPGICERRAEMSPPESRITLRRAHPTEAEGLTELVLSSKRTWGYPETWIELWRDDLTLTPEFIERSETHVAERGGRFAGVFAVVVSAPSSELEHLWIHPEEMGRGLGRQLFLRAARIARRRGARSMIIVSDPHAEAFYLHLGARRVGSVPSKPAGRELPKLVLDLESD